MSAEEYVPRSYGNREYPPEESGVICSECGWLLDGPNAHPDARAQHTEAAVARGERHP